MPGPLPDPQRVRRNAPTIPSTNLPASGRQGAAPEVPAWVGLGAAGAAFWRWAWATPQAVAWGTNVGMEAWVARRASLEDDLAALDDVHGLDFDSLVGAENGKEFRDIVGRVAALATGRLQLLKEMREMDDRLGLTPKGMAALRWTIVADKADAPAATSKKKGNVTPMAGRRQRLTDAS